MAKELTFKEKEKLFKRKLIIEKAQELFFDKGYLNITITDIANALGLTKRTIYNYFKTKEEIYLEVILIIGEKKIKFLEESNNKISKLNGFERLRKLCLAEYNFFKESPSALSHFRLVDCIDFHTSNYPDIVEKNIELYDKKFKMVTVCIEDGIKEGSITPELDTDNYVLQLGLSLRNILFYSLCEDYNNEHMHGMKSYEWFLFFVDNYLKAIRPDK